MIRGPVGRGLKPMASIDTLGRHGHLLQMETVLHTEFNEDLTLPTATIGQLEVTQSSVHSKIGQRAGDIPVWLKASGTLAWPPKCPPDFEIRWGTFDWRESAPIQRGHVADASRQHRSRRRARLIEKRNQPMAITPAPRYQGTWQEFASVAERAEAQVTGSRP